MSTSALMECDGTATAMASSNKPHPNTPTASHPPPPNHGASLPEPLALSPEHEALATWRARRGINPASQIRLVKLAHMRYQHPDLEALTGFMGDFGMTLVKKTPTERWFRGRGTDPYVYYACGGPERRFLGGCFEVEGYADLERAAQLPGAGAIETLHDAPGGGSLLTIVDPEGFPVNLIHGQTPREADPMPPPLLTNYETEKPRVKAYQRFKPGPAAVHKLGHFGLCVQNFDAQLDFYTRHFNIVPTDFLYIEEEEKEEEADANAPNPTPPHKHKRNVAVFCHLDLGPQPVDHHAFFLSTNPTSHVHHASFEVHDHDSQQLGHAWLAGRGYRSVWGVGRHVLGSQIFDYWWDPAGFMIEHYADGDLVDDGTPVGYAAAGDERLAVWGPEVPGDFLD